MRLEITCKKCNKEFGIDSKAISRFDLENEIGRYFKESCKECGTENEYHVNDVFAENSGVGPVIYVVTAIALLFTFILYLTNTGVYSLIVLLVPIFIWMRLKQSNEKAINLFNEHKVSKTRDDE